MNILKITKTLNAAIFGKGVLLILHSSTAYDDKILKKKERKKKSTKNCTVLNTVQYLQKKSPTFKNSFRFMVTELYTW